MQYMPGAKTHFGLGAATSALYYAVECEQKNQNYNLEEILFAAAGGGISGVMPDQIEPAKTPNHREFFHSVLFAAGLGTGTTEIDRLDLTEKQKAMAKSLSAGYLSHLAADATTPKRLPLVD
jgi:membrane-bound metal-dependent hydrolase YbcI (DUF457 family)